MLKKAKAILSVTPALAMYKKWIAGLLTVTILFSTTLASPVSRASSEASSPEEITVSLGERGSGNGHRGGKRDPGGDDRSTGENRTGGEYRRGSDEENGPGGENHMGGEHRHDSGGEDHTGGENHAGGEHRRDTVGKSRPGGESSNTTGEPGNADISITPSNPFVDKNPSTGDPGGLGGSGDADLPGDGFMCISPMMLVIDPGDPTKDRMVDIVGNGTVTVDQDGTTTGDAVDQWMGSINTYTFTPTPMKGYKFTGWKVMGTLGSGDTITYNGDKLIFGANTIDYKSSDLYFIAIFEKLETPTPPETPTPNPPQFPTLKPILVTPTPIPTPVPTAMPIPTATPSLESIMDAVGDVKDDDLAKFLSSFFISLLIGILMENGNDLGAIIKVMNCYIATSVYGSYDCSEVWTLRRFRDNTLEQSAIGKAFINVYYAVSPAMVESYGENEWFKELFKTFLDKAVIWLQANGVDSSPYDDASPEGGETINLISFLLYMREDLSALLTGLKTLSDEGIIDLDTMFNRYEEERALKDAIACFFKEHAANGEMDDLLERYKGDGTLENAIAGYLREYAQNGEIGFDALLALFGGDAVLARAVNEIAWGRLDTVLALYGGEEALADAIAGFIRGLAEGDIETLISRYEVEAMLENAFVDFIRGCAVSGEIDFEALTTLIKAE